MRTHISCSTFLSILIFTSQIYASSANGILITAPTGGETFIIGQKQYVRLSDKTKFKLVMVELSRDGGTTFESLGQIDNTVKDKSLKNVLQFTVIGASSIHCVIRATGSLGNTIATGTTGEFSITDGSNPGGGTVVTASSISSGLNPSPYVLAADGNGGASWISPTSLGIGGSGGVSAITPGPGISVTGPASTPTIGAVFGSSAGTVVEGNDARLSDPRPPTAGSSSYIQNQTAAPQNAGFNISGNGTIGGNLNVTGTVSLATSTRYYSVHYSEFVLDLNSGGGNWLDFINGYCDLIMQTPATRSVFAPVHLNARRLGDRKNFRQVARLSK